MYWPVRELLLDAITNPKLSSSARSSTTSKQASGELGGEKLETLEVWEGADPGVWKAVGPGIWKGPAFEMLEVWAGVVGAFIREGPSSLKRLGPFENQLSPM